MPLSEKQLSFRQEQNAKDLFANYAEYNKNLRTWFITFGVGGPATILLNTGLRDALIASGYMAGVVYAFLVGCAVQILIGFLNKYWTWYQYCEEISVDPHPASRLQKVFEFCGRHVWTDILADLVTVACFGYAVLMIVRTFVS